MSSKEEKFGINSSDSQPQPDPTPQLPNEPTDRIVKGLGDDADSIGTNIPPNRINNDD